MNDELPKRAKQNAVAIITAAVNRDVQMLSDVISDITIVEAQATIASLAGMTAGCLDHLAAELHVSTEQFLAQMGAIAALE